MKVAGTVPLMTSSIGQCVPPPVAQPGSSTDGSSVGTRRHAAGTSARGLTGRGEELLHAVGRVDLQ